MQKLYAHVTSIGRIQHALAAGGELSSVAAYLTFDEVSQESASQNLPHPFSPFADRFTGGRIIDHALVSAYRTSGRSPRN
jgi:hypothetical protein